MGAACGVFRVVFHLHLFHLVVRVVGDYNLYGVDYGAYACRTFVEVFADAELKQRDVVDSLEFGVSDAVDKRFY